MYLLQIGTYESSENWPGELKIITGEYSKFLKDRKTDAKLNS